MLRNVLKDLRKGERLSSVLPTKWIAVLTFGWSAIFLVLFPNFSEWWATLPFFILATKGVDLSIFNGVFLSILWMVYILFITFPFQVVMGRFFVLLVYMPILGVVFYKKPHEPASRMFLFLETVFWDFPLICWIKLISKMGGRALQPFCSKINSFLFVGSMPLAEDVEYLYKEKNVGLVINMCREYKGPVAEYAKYGIQQVHLPTPDVCEPSYSNIVHGVQRVCKFLDEQEEKFKKTKELQVRDGDDGEESVGVTDEPKTVFIHCKAGRGRAATMALCTLMVAEDMPAEQAMDILRKRRKVVEPSVRHFKVVEKFVERMEVYENNFDALYLHEYALAE